MRKAVGWFVLPVLVLVGVAVFLLAQPKPPAPEVPPVPIVSSRAPEPTPAPAPQKDFLMPSPSSKEPKAKDAQVRLKEALARLSDRGKVSNAAQVRAQVEALVADGQVSERMARPVLEALNQQR